MSDGSHPRDLERRINTLEQIIVPRREHDLVTESLDERIKRLEDSLRWTIRLVATTTVTLLAQIVITSIILMSRGS